MKKRIFLLCLLLTLSSNALSWNITTKKSDMLNHEDAIMLVPVNNSKLIGFRCKKGTLSLTFFITDQNIILKKNLYRELIFKIDDITFSMVGAFTRQNNLSLGITTDDQESLIAILKRLKNKPRDFYVLEEMEYYYLPHKVGLSDPAESINKFVKLCNISL